MKTEAEIRRVVDWLRSAARGGMAANQFGQLDTQTKVHLLQLASNLEALLWVLGEGIDDSFSAFVESCIEVHGAGGPVM